MAPFGFPRSAQLLTCAVGCWLACVAGPAAAAPLTPKEQAGLMVFRDKNLSQPAGQACASCHDAKVAFSDSIARSPTSRGVDRTLFGPRNARTSTLPVSYVLTTSVASMICPIDSE